jgi:broad specificity phosphatase PhoE
MTMLMLMHGHLRIGRALVEQQAWDDAVMHFRHPIEEIYGELEAELKQRQVEDFRAELDALAGHVRDQEHEPFEQAFDRVQAAIDTAVAALPAEVRNSATFKLNVAMRLLQQAALEYNAAIADGRIVNVAEYQDSRGFVWTAAELLHDVAAELGRRDAEAWQMMETLLADIKRAWPDVQPPAEPAQPVSRVLSNISRLDLQASRLR